MCPADIDPLRYVGWLVNPTRLMLLRFIQVQGAAATLQGRLTLIILGPNWCRAWPCPHNGAYRGQKPYQIPRRESPSLQVAEDERQRRRHLWTGRVSWVV